ncbi:MAG: SDR family oxidoreductase [Acidimicrobiales bacterium]|jgi:NAD(P)-dependent dehydrogenase (short-subunit alcohol dehydrogenase family)|nr:SDR family oxidoreductase [Acidimicrobiales bacterium]
MTDQTTRFEGRVALVTGAGSGIGRATAARLAAEGASVLGVDISEAGLAGTVELIGARGGGRIETSVNDVSRPEECRAAVATAIDAFGRLDVLGNVAGIARSEHVTEVSEERYRQMFGVNTDGPFFMCQAAIPHLLETDGNIVNIASNAGLMGQAYTVVYCMTKGAVVQLTRALAMEFATTGMRVNAIAPGGVESNLTASYEMPAEIDFDLMRPYMGFRGMGQPDDIAGLFAFVASDEGRNIHGAILSSDNGITAG